MGTERYTRRGGRTALLAAVGLAALVAVAGCELDVNDPDIVTPQQLEGPGAVEPQINGVVGDFQESYDDVIRYVALFTDEMILGGTFPSRIDVDERNITVNNVTLTTDLYEPLHVSRASADQIVEDFTANLEDPAFSEVTGDLREGISLGQLYGGYTRIVFAELYCQSIFGGPDGESSPVGSNARMEEALSVLQEAEASAQEAGLSDVATAARVGQGRALTWLGRYGEAAQAVSDVPTNFTFFSRYSANNVTEQGNEMHLFTFGASGFSVRWTIGDGTDGGRHNERWPHYVQWAEQGLLDSIPPVESVELGVQSTLQLLYDSPDDNVVLASGWEARMIEAENMLRNGSSEAAEDLVNGLLTDPSVNPMLDVNPDLPLGPFDTVDFTGNLQDDLRDLAYARIAGLWLSGTRQGTFRRFSQGDGVDLYPQGTQGDDESFPIVSQEIDNNPNVSSGCGG